jgi:DNA-binding NtrC family response regulator
MKKYRLLLIEDDINLLKHWKMYLEDQGYLVDTAENGKIALNLWEDNIYDVILVDLRMPEVDGMDVIKEVKRKQPNTQIIIISGQGKDNDLIEAINNHVFAYLPKSDTDITDIVAKTAEALDNRDYVLLSLDKMAEKDADKTVILAGKESYSAQRLYDEVRKGSDFGNKFQKELKDTLTEFEPSTQTASELLAIKGVQ